MQRLLTVSCHLMSVKQHSPLSQAESLVLLSWSFYWQLITIQYLNILKDQHSARSRNACWNTWCFMCCLTKATLAEISDCVWLSQPWLSKWSPHFSWGKWIWPFSHVGSSFGPRWKSHSTFVCTLACSILSESETSWTSQWVKYSIFGPCPSTSTKTKAALNHVAKYLLEMPKTRKTVRQHFVIEAQYQTCWAEVTQYYEIHTKFVCIWEDNSFLSWCCERVWWNYLEQILKFPVKKLCSDLCNSLCHYGLLNIIIKDATLLHNNSHHSLWEQRLCLILIKHITLTFVLHIRAYYTGQ